jgi:hypothetical protein
MRIPRFGRLLVVLCLIVGGAALSPRRADGQIISNLDQGSQGSATNTLTAWYGIGFTTDATAYQLTNVVAVLSKVSDGDNISLDIRSNSSDSPGSLLANLTTTQMLLGNGNSSNITFTPSSTLTLQANTAYWITANITTGSVNWQTSNSTTTTGPGSLLTPNFLANSSDQGGTWLTPTLLGNGNKTLLFEVNGTPVSTGTPELGSLAIASVAVLLGLGGALVRKQAGRRDAANH